MKSGETAVLNVSLEIKSEFSSVIFTLKSDGVVLAKTYPDDKTILFDGKHKFTIKLTQEDTTKLLGAYNLEAQVNFNDGSVAKSEIYRGYCEPTLGTEFIENNLGTIDQDTNISLKMASIVIVESTVAWTPNIDEDGNLTWKKTDKSTAPDQYNVKGIKGDQGETGPQGPAGKDGSDGHTPTEDELNSLIEAQIKILIKDGNEEEY